MWEERDGGGEEGGAGHSVIQRVVSPRSAAGRGFTAKRGRKKKGKKRKGQKKRTKAADTLKGDFVKIAHRKCRFQHTHTRPSD